MRLLPTNPQEPLIFREGTYGFSTDQNFSSETSRLTEDSKYDIFVGDLSGDKVSNGGSASDWAIYSGFARATYNYDEKYLLEFNIRNDYSSYSYYKSP